MRSHGIVIVAPHGTRRALAVVILPVSGIHSAEAGRSYRQQRPRDCVPTIGPLGFYGNGDGGSCCLRYFRQLSQDRDAQCPPPLQVPATTGSYRYRVSLQAATGP